MSAHPLTPLAAAALHVDRAPERALEVECGDGSGALFLAREFPSARVRGVDRSERSVREATARVGLDPEGRIAFKVGAPTSLPYPDDFFDLVAQVDGRPAPREAGRVLKPGGYLIVARSRRSRVPFEPGERWLRTSLARGGFEPVQAGEAGEGAFLVARLRGGGRAARSE